MPVFNIPQGPDYGEFGRSMAGIIRSQEKPWDMEKSIMSIRAMSEQLAHEQEMFPLKLEQMQMENRLTSDKVKAFEIENSPERLNAAADLKMQEDQFKIAGMKDAYDQRNADKEFQDKYLPSLMKSISMNDMETFSKVSLEIVNSPNGGKMAGKILEMRKSLTEQQNSEMDSKTKAVQFSLMQKAMKQAEDKARLRAYVMGEQKTLLKEEHDTETLGKPLADIQSPVDATAAIKRVIGKKLLEDPTNPVLQKIAEDPAIIPTEPGLVRNVGAVLSFPFKAAAYGLRGGPAIDDAALEAEAIK